jgi:hypothetical protein
MPLPGTIRDERGYTEAERGQAEDDQQIFMDLNVRKKLFPGAFLYRQLSLIRASTERKLSSMAGTFLTSLRQDVILS